MDRQNFIKDSDITFRIRITPESSVPTFVHNYRIKGYNDCLLSIFKRLLKTIFLKSKCCSDFLCKMHAQINVFFFLFFADIENTCSLARICKRLTIRH